MQETIVNINIAPKFISMNSFEFLLSKGEDCHPMNIPQVKHQQCINPINYKET